MVKLFDLPMRGDLCLLLDGTTSMIAGERWTYAKELGARVCVGALRAGHRVKLIYDHQYSLKESPLITHLEDLPLIWSSLIKPPQGGSGDPSLRRATLNRLSASSTLVYITDGVVATHEWGPLRSDLSEAQPQDKESLLNSEEQLAGAIGRLQRVIYVCLTEQEVDQPPIGITLCSPEVDQRHSTGRPPLTKAEAEEALYLLREHRSTQERLLSTYHHSQWLSFEVTEQSIDQCLQRLIRALK